MWHLRQCAQKSAFHEVSLTARQFAGKVTILRFHLQPWDIRATYLTSNSVENCMSLKKAAMVSVRHQRPQKKHVNSRPRNVQSFSSVHQCTVLHCMLTR